MHNNKLYFGGKSSCATLEFTTIKVNKLCECIGVLLNNINMSELVEGPEPPKRKLTEAEKARIERNRVKAQFLRSSKVVTRSVIILPGACTVYH